MSYSRKAGLGLATLALLGLAAVSPVKAQTPGYTITNTTSPNTLGNPPLTLGFQFTANQGLTVTALGLFDSGQDGLVDSHPIGIFNSSGTLLTSTTLASGTANPLVNQFRYAGVAPLTLAAGQNYFIGALYTTSNDPLIFPRGATGFATNSSITFVNASFGSGGTLSFPSGNAGNSPGYFGPNFLFTPGGPAAVPEPSQTAALGLGVLGLAGLIVKARKRKAVRA